MKRKTFAGVVLTCALAAGSAVCSYAAPAAQPAQGQDFAYEVPAEKPEGKEEAKDPECEEKEGGFLERIRESVDRFFNRETKEEAVEEEKAQPGAKGQETSFSDGKGSGERPVIQEKDDGERKAGGGFGNRDAKAERPTRPENDGSRTPEGSFGNSDGEGIKPGAR